MLGLRKGRKGCNFFPFELVGWALRGLGASAVFSIISAFASVGAVTGAVVMASLTCGSDGERAGASCGGGNFVKKRRRRGSSDFASLRCP